MNNKQATSLNIQNKPSAPNAQELPSSPTNAAYLSPTNKHPYTFKPQKKHLSRSAKIAVLCIGLLLILILLAPYILPYQPNEQHLDSAFESISKAHWLGSDYLGRDILTRLIYGARISLGATFITLGIIVLLGVSVGGICGFVGGVIDRVLMRFCDIFLSLPTLVLSLFLVSILGSGLENVIIAIALTHWAWYARIVRSIVFSLKSKEFVLLSQTFGLNMWQNFRRNMLPPILSQCLVLASMDIGHIILHIAGLSFLGLGVQPPNAEWGVMISDCEDYLWSNPTLLLYPGLALFITIALFNILGEGLRDYMDSDIESLRQNHLT